MRKVVIAVDSFKGSLSSRQVAEAAAAAVREVFPACETVCLDVADGGEGTLEALCGILEADSAAVVIAAAREHIRRISEGAEKREDPAADQPESSVTELYRNLNPEGQREVSRLMRLMAYMETFRKV